ncbi:ACT domain-containing protein [Aggregatimonas sangjinii]|uniref:ACT domain-containing protein n=1 Tax=Aggregatimonas sangjinii TaxID=2583587 RepID=A0A5B7SYK4_9FLAO|nr:ACT domain-containing protein [Aggregatimonas sangjinii]QCX02193.1 ACT domain-containing protein [Aggregatimonas sangjinii]
MAGETDIFKLIKGMTPRLHSGIYVFCSVKSLQGIDREQTICEFKEREGTTIIIEKHKADELQLSYDYSAAWITLEIHSSLEAVGLTAIISNELAQNNISCNIVAGYFHDHLFLAKNDAEKGMNVLRKLVKKHQ